MLIIFAQSTVSTEPSKCALYYPTTRMNYKTLLIGWFLDNLEINTIKITCFFDNPAFIPLISPDLRNHHEGYAMLTQQPFCTFTILDICSMDQNANHQPIRIDEKCAFASLHLFFPRHTPDLRLLRWS